MSDLQKYIDETLADLEENRIGRIAKLMAENERLREELAALKAELAEAKREIQVFRNHAAMAEELKAQPAQEPSQWANDAAAIMARFINLSSTPNEEEWCAVAYEATKLLNVVPQPAQEPVACPDCLGSEFQGYKRGIRCETCNGTGEIEQPTAEVERDAALNEILGFLMGENQLEGVWFGDPHPTKNGNFWWRHNILAAMQKGEGE